MGSDRIPNASQHRLICWVGQRRDVVVRGYGGRRTCHGNTKPTCHLRASPCLEQRPHRRPEAAAQAQTRVGETKLSLSCWVKQPVHPVTGDSPIGRVLRCSFPEADMAYLQRIQLVRFQKSLLSMKNPQSERRTTTERYVGIDVAQEQCALCIVDDAGTILFEGSCATDPDKIVHTIAAEVGEVEKIVHELGPLSIWLTRELIKRSAPVVCIDALAAHKVLSARERLIRIRMDIEGQVRGLLKAYGIGLGPVNAGYSRKSFRDQLGLAIKGVPSLEMIFASLIAVHETVCLETTAIDERVQRLAKDAPLARRLTSIP